MGSVLKPFCDNERYPVYPNLVHNLNKIYSVYSSKKNMLAKLIVQKISTRSHYFIVVKTLACSMRELQSKNKMWSQINDGGFSLTEPCSLNGCSL